MLSLLRNYSGYTLASSIKLRPSVLHVATRHFLTTYPDHSPARKAAIIEPSIQKSGGKRDVESKKKSTDSKKGNLPAKPKRITKKDITPPSKRPMGSFAAFAVQYRAKKQQETQSSVRLADSLRDAAVAWANLSEEEKQPYAPSREALEAHRLALKEWEESLSVEAKRALKLRRRREKGTGYALFVSETFVQAVGGTFGEKISDRGAAWRSLPNETKAAYKKRAAETVFGVRARRAAQHQRDMEREAKRKEAKKVKDKAHKRKEQEKKAEKAKQRKAAAAKSKREKVNA